MVTVLPEKYLEVREAILFENVKDAKQILHNYVEDGTIVDYALDELDGDVAVKFGENEKFWLMTGGKPQQVSGNG